MQRHPVDLVSLVFGILFLGTVGVATMIGELGWDRFTANAWLVNMEKHREEIWPILESTYGHEHAGLWWMRWRIFFMACAELFGYDDGQQWWVSHYLFERPAT